MLYVGNNYNNSLNGNNNLGSNGRFAGIALSNAKTFNMKTYNSLYEKIYNLSNLILAWRKARRYKTREIYVMKFEQDTLSKLFRLHEELKAQTYKPKPLIPFIIKDPKTRKISKSAFRDRIVHHALVQVIEPIFEKIFIHDSCANRIGKGNLFAIRRFYRFLRRVSRNGKIIKNKFNDNNFVCGYCLKADIKHYFEEVNHKILIKIIRRKITDEKIIWLIEQIFSNVIIGGGAFQVWKRKECLLEI